LEKFNAAALMAGTARNGKEAAYRPRKSLMTQAADATARTPASQRKANQASR